MRSRSPGASESWTVPDVIRIDEPFTGPERGILDGFLDWHRSTLLWKCAGLTGEQLALAPVPPSNLSLLGIIRHMADVERAWFRIRFRGEPLPKLYDYEDAAFEHGDPARAEANFAAFTDECDLARRLTSASRSAVRRSRCTRFFSCLTSGTCCRRTSMPMPLPGTRSRYRPLVARPPAWYPSTPAQNRAERARSKQSITITSSPFR